MLVHPYLYHSTLLKACTVAGSSVILMADQFKGKQFHATVWYLFQVGAEREDHVRYCYLHHVRAAMLRAARDRVEHVYQGQAGGCLQQEEAAGRVRHEDLHRHRDV